MDMWQLLGLQKKLTVEQAAQLWTRARHDKVTRAAEGVITDAIESRELAADIVRWGVYYADLGTELPEGNINQHETTVKRRDFDAWLKSIGQTIALPPEVVVPEVSQQAPTEPELQIVEAGGSAGPDDARKIEFGTVSNIATGKPVTTKRISETFAPPKGRTQENWDKTLSDPPDWMRDARLSAGKAGVSALWNPAHFAICMVAKRHIGKGNATTIIKREFNDWLGDWENRATLL